MKIRFALIVLVALAPSAQSRPLKDDAFFQAARKASFYCELASGDVAVAMEYQAASLPESRQKLLDCLLEARKDLLAELKAIPTTSGSNGVREAAKRVYSSWDPYSTFLVRGVSSRESQRSPVAQEFRQALASYQTEVELED